MKVIIAEHDEEIATQLNSLLKFYNMFDVIEVFPTAETAIQHIRHNSVDLVLSNITLGGGMVSSDGTFLALNITKNYPETMVVLYSDSGDYAYMAFETGCTEYFNLPLKSNEMQRVISRVMNMYELLQYKREASNRSIMIKTSNGYRLEKISNILFVERENRKNKIVSADGKEYYLSGYSMDELEVMLQGYNFYRCYQSFIVNLALISFINVNSEKRSYSILFEGYSGEVLLSRDKYPEIMNLLKNKYIQLNV